MSHASNLPGVAVIGAGFIGPVHIEALRRAGQQVRGLLGSSLARSQQAAQQWNIPVAYASFDEVLADEHVFAVHITTPNRLHFEQASQALRAGKHVMCEKPLAMNAEESAALVRLAAETGRAAGVAYNIRFYPLCHEARERVRQGEFGDLYHVAGSYVQDWLLKPTDFNWRVLAEEGGDLRAVADIGTHWLDLIQFIAGEPIVAVCADLQTVHNERQRPQGGVETFTGKTRAITQTFAVPVTTDDYGGILLEFASGARGSLWVSQVSAGRKNCLRWELSAQHGSMCWNSERPDELWIGRRDGANESLLRDPALLSDSARAITHYPGGHNEGFPDTFKQLFRCFYDYIAAGDYTRPAPFPTFADGHREILLCDAILASHRQRAWVRIKESTS